MNRLKERSWLFLIVEFFSVFIGIYSAFLLDDYREAKEENRTRVKYFESFMSELTNYKYKANWQINYIDSFLVNFEQKLERAEKPELIYHKNLDFTINTFIVEAAFRESHFKAIHSDYLSSLSRGSNLLHYIKDQVHFFQKDCRKLLFSQTYNTDRFYKKNGHLKKEYGWYIGELKHIRYYLNQLILTIDKGAIPETRELILQFKGK